MGQHNFAAAWRGETVVFGASRPGYSSKRVPPKVVEQWIEFMRANTVARVCCLLPTEQLAYYEADLLSTYRAAFGSEKVCSAPIADYHLCDLGLLTGAILPFLRASEEAGDRVVVHCSGGSGRTGHVLAAWVAFRYDCSPQCAIEKVACTGRNPREAVQAGNATAAELEDLLRAVRTRP